MVFESLVNSFGNVWEFVSEFILLIIMIIFLAIFFVVQYYLIKFYKFIFVSIFTFPPIKTVIYDYIKEKFKLDLNKFEKLTKTLFREEKTLFSGNDIN